MVHPKKQSSFRHFEYRHVAAVVGTSSFGSGKSNFFQKVILKYNKTVSLHTSVFLRRARSGAAPVDLESSPGTGNRTVQKRTRKNTSARTPAKVRGKYSRRAVRGRFQRKKKLRKRRSICQKRIPYFRIPRRVSETIAFGGKNRRIEERIFSYDSKFLPKRNPCRGFSCGFCRQLPLLASR